MRRRQRKVIALERCDRPDGEVFDRYGVSVDEKRRAMFQGLILLAVADHYIRQIKSEDE